jgi:hypothetical protein
MPRRGPTHASRLLSTIVDRQILQRDRLAMELRVPVALLDQWLANERPIPFERQLVLANLLIERVPLLAREGYRLRDQLRATIAYHTHVTKTHLTAPVSRFKPLRNDSPDQRPG